MSENKDRAARLFTYIEEALDYNREPELNFNDLTVDDYQWFVADLVQHEKNLKVRTKKDNFEDREESDENDEETSGGQTTSWFEVKKENIKNSPQPPSILEGWVLKDDDMFKKPDCRELKEIHVQFEESEKREKAFNKLVDRAENYDGESQEFEHKVPDTLDGWIDIDKSRLDPIDQINKRQSKKKSVKFSDSNKRVDAFSNYLDSWKGWKKEMEPVKKPMNSMINFLLYTGRLRTKVTT